MYKARKIAVKLRYTQQMSSLMRCAKYNTYTYKHPYTKNGPSGPTAGEQAELPEFTIKEKEC